MYSGGHFKETEECQSGHRSSLFLPYVSFLNVEWNFAQISSLLGDNSGSFFLGTYLVLVWLDMEGNHTRRSWTDVTALIFVVD